MNLEFFAQGAYSHPPASQPLRQALGEFRAFGKPTRRFTSSVLKSDGAELCKVDTFVNEFWTAAQRQAHRLHEISYRACFKPQLPRFFIERLTKPGEVVYDPFMGRGTTPLEAALLGRVPFGCDVNPLSRFLTQPRLAPPTYAAIENRLKQIDLTRATPCPEQLLVFYHPDTLRAIGALRAHLLEQATKGELTPEDEWIRMVALNRLTGHSPGFFSVYTLPPNQAVSVKSQEKINLKRNQKPPARDVISIILKKTRSLMGIGLLENAAHRLAEASQKSMLICGPADCTPQIQDASVSLVVTSPPFLDVVDYATDNWLRCWFAGVDPTTVKLTVPRKIEDWEAAMTLVFTELRRVLRPGGHIAFEVGEVHRGKTLLDHSVVRSSVAAGLEPELLVINDQKFTKTSNCWGVSNMSSGTNTNRIVVIRRP